MKTQQPMFGKRLSPKCRLQHIRADKNEHMEVVLLGQRPLASQDAHITLHSGTGSMTLDARRLDFLAPLDAAGLVAIAHSPAAAGMPLTLYLPEDDDARAYFLQAGILEALPDRVVVQGHNPSARHRFPAHRMMPVRLLTEATAGSVGNEFGELVTSQYPFESGPHITAACGELLSNAVEHGACEPGAFVAAQLYTGATTGTTRLELAVCDNGIGVLRSLQLNPQWAHLTRDAQALNTARQYRASGVPSATRGNGLPRLIDVANSHGELTLGLRSGYGELLVGSGRSRVRDKGDQTQGMWAWLTHLAT